MLVPFGVGPEILWQTDLFADLPPETASWLVERCRWREVTSDDLLIDGTVRQPHGVFILADGRAEVFRNKNKNGSFVSLANLNAVDCFGEFAAITGEPGSASVRCTSPSVVGEIHPSDFVELLKERTVLSIRLLSKVIHKMRRMDEAFEAAHIRNSSREALIRDVHRDLMVSSL